MEKTKLKTVPPACHRHIPQTHTASKRQAGTPAGNITARMQHTVYNVCKPWEKVTGSDRSFFKKWLRRSHHCSTENRRNMLRSVCHFWFLTPDQSKYTPDQSIPNDENACLKSYQFVRLPSSQYPSQIIPLDQAPKRFRHYRDKEQTLERLILSFEIPKSFHWHFQDILSSFSLHPELVPWVELSVKQVLLFLKDNAIMIMLALLKQATLRCIRWI